MTNGKIFLFNDNGKTLTPMTETGYVTEGDLQTFLADHTLSAPINVTSRDEVIRLYNMIMEKFTSASPGGLA
jgi:hypothetical protein